MASISDDAGDRRRILFTDGSSKRRAIRLGKIDRKSADAICRHVESLLGARIGGQPIPKDTASWLASIGDTLRAKLAAVGLIEARGSVPTLGEFLDGYLKERAGEVKPGTMLVLGQSARWLRSHFGDETRIDAITVAGADAYRSWILKDRARATANKWSRYAKEFFGVALRRGLVGANPFAHLKGLAVVGNATRRVLIPDAEIRRVLGVIPCPQFRLFVALARYGGLRVPSESLALTWADVNWEKNRLIVRASKTEHHADGGIRVVPIFAELRPYLDACWDVAAEGQSEVITRYDAGANLRTQLNRWILQAGLKPWPKPFQNMRATRATELADQFPSHVCAKWLGHTERIADEFYRSVTDEHYTRATQSGAKSGAVGAQNQAQTGADMKRPERTNSNEVLELQAFRPHLSAPVFSCSDIQMGDTGFEPVTSSV